MTRYQYEEIKDDPKRRSNPSIHPSTMRRLIKPHTSYTQRTRPPSYDALPVLESVFVVVKDIGVRSSPKSEETRDPHQGVRQKTQRRGPGGGDIESGEGRVLTEGAACD